MSNNTDIKYTKCYGETIAFSPNSAKETCQREFGNDWSTSKTFDNTSCLSNTTQIGCIQIPYTQTIVNVTVKPITQVVKKL